MLTSVWPDSCHSLNFGRPRRIGAGQRLVGSLIDTPRPVVTHSLPER